MNGQYVGHHQLNDGFDEITCLPKYLISYYFCILITLKCPK